MPGSLATDFPVSILPTSPGANLNLKSDRQNQTYRENVPMMRKTAATALALLTIACVLKFIGNTVTIYSAASASSEQNSDAANATQIGLQYETFFTKQNVNWDRSQASGSIGLYNGTEEAVPILGKYSSYDTSIL